MSDLKLNNDLHALDNYKPIPNHDWQLHWLDDQPMLFSKSNDIVHLLNPVAGFIWTCCDGKTDVKAIRKALQEVFVDSQDEVAKDLPDTLKLWQEQELIDFEQPLKKRQHHKLCIGMATYDDFDGVYFSVQAIQLYHPEVAEEIGILVVDNNPYGAVAEALQKLENAIPNYYYVPYTETTSTAVRDVIFREAEADYVLCIDCHVLIMPGAIRKLIDFLDDNPDCYDLLQGPMLLDDMKSLFTHLNLEWDRGMYGIWKTDERGKDIDAQAFEIPIQSLGLFACRKDAWLGFNPRFRGFACDEGYIHEKFRQQGKRTLCLPFLRWLSRFQCPLNFTLSNITEHVFEDHLVLLNHATNQLLLLNPLARLVWQSFAQGHSDEQVIEQLADLCNSSKSIAEQHVKEICDNWYKHKILIRSVESETPLMPKAENHSVVSSRFNTQSLNTQKIYLLANTPFSLRFNDKDAFANHIHSLFAYMEVHDQQPLKNFTLIRTAHKHILLADGYELFGSELFRNPFFEKITGYFVHEILKLSYLNTEWLAMIHAMAVAYGEKAVVMPAPSGYGKSTLTAALLKEGFSYLGDDLVPIQRGTHQITPLFTSLRIRKGSWPILDAHYPELKELPVYNSRVRYVRYLNPSQYIKTKARLPVTALVFPRYQSGQSVTLKPISATESLQRLIKNHVWLGNHLENDRVSEFLTWLRGLPSFSFDYCELEPAVQKIQDLLSV